MPPDPPPIAHAVALETTLLCHGVPRTAAPDLARRLRRAIQAEGAQAALIGVQGGEALVAMTDNQLDQLLARDPIPKLNTSNLGMALAGQHGGCGATTVSATIELAARAGLRVMATGAIGGVHLPDEPDTPALDVSSDLIALTRWPVAVVCSGVKSILDILTTREMLETLGVPVVGYRTDRFPAFYLRESAATVDARVDDVSDLAQLVARELARTGRGILIANPIPAEDELDPADLDRWMREAAGDVHAAGRARTPALLAALHTRSGGATLRANIALALSNARLAAQIAALAHH